MPSYHKIMIRHRPEIGSLLSLIEATLGPVIPNAILANNLASSLSGIALDKALNVRPLKGTSGKLWRTTGSCV